MSWLSDLAGKAENLLNNIDQGTASVLQTRNKTEVMYADTQPWLPRLTRRPLTKTSRKPVAEGRTTNSPTRKNTPPVKQYPNLRYVERKEPLKSSLKKTQKKMYEANRASAPHTMTGGDERIRTIDDDEVVMHDYGSAYRRRSLPNNKDIEEIINRTNRMESISVENQMMKNEVAVCNQEISDLLDKLRTVEDDIKEADAKFENLEKLHKNVKNEKESLSNELTMIKEKTGPPGFDLPYSDLSSAYRALEQDFASINDRNMELQKQLKEMEMSKISNSSIQMKLENDLRFAHMTLSDLRADLEKSRNECQRVQSDWDAYKLRVKSMLLSKDKELEALQKNPDFTEATRMLAEQVEGLREERDELSAAVTRSRGECQEATRRVEQAEGRTHAAERLVAALREALREERVVRNRAENQCILNNKALKNLQMETSLQIADLHSTLRERETEIHNYRTARNHSTTSICPVTDGSALNVAECDRLHESISSEKVQLLTQSLIVKQGRIDNLMAENSTLKLQIERIEAHHRLEISNLHSNQRLINVNDGDALLKTKIGSGGYTANSLLGKVSLRIGVFMRRHPMFRLFIILYMVGLHMWVMLVLLTYTPEIHSP